MIKRQMTPAMRKKYAFPGSVYERTCPTCGAKPFEFCFGRNGSNKSAEFPHVSRSASYTGHGHKGRAFHR
jgi:hypothetical protein